MKYELTNETQEVDGITLHRIRALQDFDSVSAGNFGGWIEAPNNLSQDGNAWVSDDAWVSGNARVSGNAWVSDDAWVSGNARVFGNAQVFGNAWVFGNAQVFGNAWVSDDAWVSGNARVFGQARVNQSIYLLSGNTDFDTQNNLLGTIRNSLNLMPVNGELLFYKRVNKDLSSEYDNSFFYQIGDVAEVKNYNPNPSISCGAGIHGSHANYYPIQTGDDRVILALSSKVEDIICCQEGKIRVKKARVLGICDS
jgi:carbonic anhydrase/acetyltransferase-like protein (isoleucine patch superfamily)